MKIMSVMLCTTLFMTMPLAYAEESENPKLGTIKTTEEGKAFMYKLNQAQNWFENEIVSKIRDRPEASKVQSFLLRPESPTDSIVARFNLKEDGSIGKVEIVSECPAEDIKQFVITLVKSSNPKTVPPNNLTCGMGTISFNLDEQKQLFVAGRLSSKNQAVERKLPVKTEQ